MARRGKNAEKKPRALVAEDAEGIRTYLASLLEIKGYEVDTAEDGRRALALLEGGAAPDVILLDIMMPDVDGWETLGRLREEPNARDVPVIIFTAREHTRGPQLARDLGAYAYLRKPFEAEELIDLVSRCAASAPAAENA